MKKTFIFVISIILATTISAQYENADAVFEKITKEYTLNEDGSMEYHYFKELNLISYLSFNRLYGETFIVYNPEYQNLEINKSYTIMADGKKVETPDNAFNEVLPRAAAHSVNFNHLREMVVTHTALERDATIYLDYTIHTKKDFWPALMGNELIEESSPIREMEIIVRVPSDVELHHKMFNLRTAPEIVVQGRQKVYTWKFMGIKASPKESFRGEFHPETPRLTFSTAKDMEAVTGWMTDQKAFDLNLSDEMITFAKKMKSEKKDEINTMLAIQKEVVENMAYDRVSPEWAGFRARTPVEVWKSNGGTRLEKSILFAALLRAADFNAIPAMTAPEKFFDKKQGNLLIFDQALVSVNTKGYGTIYLSAVSKQDQSLQYNLEGEVIVALEKNTGLQVVKPSAGKNRIEVEGNFDFETIARLTGLLEVELTGKTNPFLDLHQDTSSTRSLFTGSVIPKGNEAIKIENSNPEKSELTIEVEKSDSLQGIHGYYRWELPVMRNGFESWRIQYLSSHRDDPFVLPNTLNESYTYSIEIPEGFAIANRNKDISLKSAAGSVKIAMKIKDTSIKIERELKLDKKIIEVTGYEEFREMINHWLDEDYRMIIIEQK